jgi:hypothetical protein
MPLGRGSAKVSATLPKKLVQRFLALAMALAIVALTTGSLTHLHSTASEEATCQVCHVSHASAPGPLAPLAIQAPTPIATLTLIESVSADFATFRAPSIPRAPPV